MSTRADFSEIGHTGGKVTFTIESDQDGQVSYQVGFEHSRPLPATICGIYAHPDGFACGNIKMGGVGEPWNPPPFPHCVAVIMASDSEGRFGHECPQCNKHFRTTDIPARFPLTCPYCALRAESFHFLTPPQRAYIKHYLAMLDGGLANVKPKSSIEVEIDMDAIADMIPGEPRPDFYPASVAQQTQFRCAKCATFNDVRGRYAYCANCGWRNNRATAEAALQSIRDKVNAGQTTAADAVKLSVSEFDSVARNYVDELERRIPMKVERRNELQGLLFHGVDRAEAILKSAFGIDFLRKQDAQREFITRMFLRRHVYEHDGGVATARYVKESGDTTVSEGDLIRETKENAHDLISCVNRMIAAFDDDFHELFPPHETCIKWAEERAARRTARKNGS